MRILCALFAPFISVAPAFALAVTADEAQARSPSTRACRVAQSRGDILPGCPAPPRQPVVRPPARSDAARERAEPLSPPPAAAPAAIANSGSPQNVLFLNDCSQAVRLLVYHDHGNGNFAPHGWYEVAASSSVVLTYPDGLSPITHAAGQPLYFYAYSATSSLIWGGTFPATVDGSTYGLAEANLSADAGRLQFGINCDGQDSK